MYWRGFFGKIQEHFIIAEAGSDTDSLYSTEVLNDGDDGCPTDCIDSIEAPYEHLDCVLCSEKHAGGDLLICFLYHFGHCYLASYVYMSLISFVFVFQHSCLRHGIQRIDSWTTPW
jgi:hypothetical protein